MFDVKRSARANPIRTDPEKGEKNRRWRERRENGVSAHPRQKGRNGQWGEWRGSPNGEEVQTQIKWVRSSKKNTKERQKKPLHRRRY